MRSRRDTGARVRGLWGAAGLFIIGVAAAVTSGGARAATYLDPLTAASFSGFDRNVAPDPGLFDVTPSVAGAVFSKAAGAENGGVELLSRFTFSGAFRITVDAAGLDTGLGFTAESGLGIKAPGCCANSAFADVFGYGNTYTLANNHLGLTELSRSGDTFALAGDTGGAAYRLNLFLDQSYGGTDANRVTFTNLTVTADTITAAVPEPAAWAMLLTGFALTGAAARRRSSSRVVAA